MRPMVPPISLMAATDSWVAVCMPAIWVPISSVALAVWAASALTSWATTAKPLPASPARAASMVALRASRLVCSAIAVMSLMTLPIRPAAFDNSPMRASVFSACFTACWAMLLDSCTCRLISPTDEVISSVAEATDWTLEDASSEAAATMPESCWVVSAVLVSVLAAASRCGRGARHRVDDAAHGRLELVGELVHRRLAGRLLALRGRLLLGGFALLDGLLLGGRAGLGRLLLAFQPNALDRVMLEDFDRLRHVADFVGAVARGNLDGVVAGGEARHRLRHSGNRPDDAAAHQIGDQRTEQQGEAGDDLLPGNRCSDVLCGIDLVGVRGLLERHLGGADLLEQRDGTRHHVVPEQIVDLENAARHRFRIRNVGDQRRLDRFDQGTDIGGQFRLLQVGEGRLRLFDRGIELRAHFRVAGCDESPIGDAHLQGASFHGGDQSRERAFHAGARLHQLGGGGVEVRADLPELRARRDKVRGDLHQGFALRPQCFDFVLEPDVECAPLVHGRGGGSRLEQLDRSRLGGNRILQVLFVLIDRVTQARPPHDLDLALRLGDARRVVAEHAHAFDVEADRRQFPDAECREPGSHQDQHAEAAIDARLQPETR